MNTMHCVLSAAIAGSLGSVTIYNNYWRLLVFRFIFGRLVSWLTYLVQSLEAQRKVEARSQASRLLVVADKGLSEAVVVCQHKAGINPLRNKEYQVRLIADFFGFTSLHCRYLEIDPVVELGA
jgi:hypothetical protein